MTKFFSPLILLFFFTGISPGKCDIIITDSTNSIIIGKQLLKLSGEKSWTIRDALNASTFTPYTTDAPNLGSSSFSTWLKFTVNNQSSTDQFFLEIAYPILDEVEVYFPDENQIYTSIELGENKPFGERKYQLPSYLFDLKIPPEATRTYYLRVKSTEQIILPIYIRTAKSLLQNQNKGHLISGIFIGIVLIMVFYNLFIFLSVRDKSYIYYVLYVAFAGLTQMGIKGYNFQYLWPDLPDFERKHAILFGSLSGLAALLFAVYFLQLKTTARYSIRIIRFFIFLFIVSFFLTVFNMAQAGFLLMQLTTGIASLTVLFISFKVMMNGYSPAKFFVSGWTILLAGSIIFLLKDSGFLPYNNFTSNVVQGASAIEMALLSFGLAYSINIFKREKEESQAAALRILKENERLILEQNMVLEKRVEVRTHELKESNNSLQQAIISLKEAQSQLIESEKMASLGQLTAGVAHEINNPINFVTSNVTPLKRDLNMILDAIAEIEKIGLLDLPPVEKREQINAFKEGIDFDYLKIEIGHLLNGMYEGATRTSEIVKSLRIFSRVDEDDLKMADINEGLESTLVIVNSLISDKRVSLQKEMGDLPLVECYPGKLNQVFLNIISNAIYALDKQHKNNGNGILSISTFLEDDSVTIKIKDNGTGMDERTKAKIFEPFFTTKDVGEGTGLGMSIVYNTIKKHNGEILLHTVPGEGTEFILKIPVCQINGS